MSFITVSDPVSEEEQELSETPDQDGDGTLSRTEEPEDLTPGDPLDRILRRVEAEKEKTGRPSKNYKKKIKPEPDPEPDTVSGSG